MPKKPPFRRPEWESAALKAFALRERRYDILACAFDIILPEMEPPKVAGPAIVRELSEDERRQLDPARQRDPTWQEDLQKARELRAAGRDVARHHGRGR